MRSIWKGSISFGLVSIPIKVISATESHGVSFRQVHTDDGGRIRYRKVCEIDGEEVPGEDIAKAYETADGNLVQLSDEELASLPLPTARTVEILGFLPAEDIDPIRLDRSYYLTGDGQAAGKPYVLLREALTRSGKVAIAKLALRNRESLGMLRVYEDTLTLHTMLWPDEIRPAEGMAPGDDISVRDAELDLADTLMEALGELDMEDLHDEYREALETLVAAKEEGAPLPAEAEPVPSRGKVVDLMSVLETSVAAAKESRGEEGETTADVRQLRGRKKAGAGSGAERRAPAKKAAGKKQAATRKTAAAKKTATQQPTRKKAAAKTASKKTTARTTAKKTASTKTAAAKKTATKRTPRKTA